KPERAIGVNRQTQQSQPLLCGHHPKIPKYFRKTLDNPWRNKYINKAPERKRFTPRFQKATEGKELNLEKRIV
ncbi:hypothetical protein, partial [Microcoleus sp. LEGE 07076]|uniref:hypothetical protein n=1 Tax=Microcoleus sp. LEGE 07076 TaxID=915322 RepID=UPI001D1513B6